LTQAKSKFTVNRLLDAKSGHCNGDDDNDQPEASDDAMLPGDDLINVELALIATTPVVGTIKMFTAAFCPIAIS
jgi:hypothetical protein